MNKIICLPILSFRILVYLRFHKANKVYIIYYELMPRYIRGFIKLFNISEIRILSFLNTIFPYRIQKIQHGDKIKDYNNIRRNVYVKIVDICEKYITQFKDDSWFNSLELLTHRSVSIPTVIKFLSHKQLHIQLLSAKLCLETNNQKSNTSSKIIIYNNYYWSNELLEIINNEQDFSNIKFKKLPQIFDFTNKLINICNLFLIQLKYIFTRGIVFKKINKKSYKIATEIFDFEMLGGTNNDTDFFIDNKNFNYSNSIFYITNTHRYVLTQNGYRYKEINNISLDKGINIIELYKLPITFQFVLSIFKWNLIVVKNIYKSNSSLVLNLLPYIFKEYIDYSSLFQHFNIKNHIHFINPNGRAPLMQNSAIITGLCRKYNAKSCGIQNRVIHSREYEFCFDSYDLYFSWGELWIKCLGSSLCFIDKIIIVGTFNLSNQNFIDSFIISNRKISKDYKNSRPNVLIFPTDIDISPSVFSGGFYSISYNLNFLKACLELSTQYPEINFNLKLKDKNHINIYNNFKEFKNLEISNYNNFNIIDRPRMKYMDLLYESELVISIGFTSPGIDAILLNKKSIYFNQLEEAGVLFNKLPNFVAKNKDQLFLFFQKLINKKMYRPLNANLLDPYQDGKAIDRIISNLVKN